jgi:pyruvate formate lyase activating enzyme
MLNVWKIDRFALHDGPGIRTNIYLKGCALRCLWCSNPEGQTSEPNLVFVQQRCIGCNLCIERCPQKALQIKPASIAGQFEMEIDRAVCNICGECVSICSSKALETWGISYSVPDLMKLVEQDRQAFRKSGGGITLTGGDPLFQWESVMELLQSCRQNGIHTAIETSACLDEEHFEPILHQVDWLFIDLKHMDSDSHLKLTGKRNDLILNNARLASAILARRRKVLVIRLVVVPGINDGQNISQAASFIRSLPYIERVELLPYHRYGENNYRLLGRIYGLPDLEPPAAEVMVGYRKLMESYGITCI